MKTDNDQIFVMKRYLEILWGTVSDGITKKDQQLYCSRAYNYGSEDFNYTLLFFNSAVKQTFKGEKKMSLLS